MKLKLKKFRPLRRMNNGKVVVAAYMTWRSVFTANYTGFDLVVDREYAGISDIELVHNQLNCLNH